MRSPLRPRLQLLLMVGACCAQMSVEVISIRLTKVAVPLYEQWGSSAMLECEYELQNSTRHIPPASLQQQPHQTAVQQQQQQQPYQQQQRPQQQQQQQGYSSSSSRSSRYRDIPIRGNDNGDGTDADDDDEAGGGGGGGSDENMGFGSRGRTVQWPQQRQQQQQRGRYHAYGAEDSAVSGGETLYSVKWYKDNEEFYRYVPRANPPQHSYKVEGIRVDHENSNNFHVKLRRVTAKSRGLYRCEVSAEAPNFSSDRAERRMEIIYMPKDNPHITPQEHEFYQLGDILRLNCTTSKSHPAQQITWLINDQPPDPDAIVPYRNIVHSQGLLTSILGLQLRLEERHFNNHYIPVRCLAGLSATIWHGNRESMLQGLPQTQQLEAHMLVRSASNGHLVASAPFTGIALAIVAAFSWSRLRTAAHRWS